MRILIMKRLLLICLVGLGLLALAGLHPARVGAAPLPQTSCTLPATVTTAAELSSCITAANTNGAGLDTITLGADITLTSPLPQIITRITLEGAGYFIDGGNSMRIFYVAPSGDFIVNRITLKNGNTTGQGGGIYNGGTLMVSNSTFSGNRATADGGGIYNSGSAVVSNSTFSGNSATDGGGISNYAVLTVIDSTFSSNSATGNGGGIFNAGQLEVTNSTISGNSATGNGGGIFVSNAGLGLTNSTIFGNSATAGGGIYANRSTLTMRNSTFSANSATGNGGGISNNETLLTMTNSTISGNNATSGGGIYYGGGEVYLAGVIFAGGSGSGNCASSDGTNFGNNYNLFDNRYNLSDDASCGFWRNSSINNATLNLGNLADNGGPTQTHLPNAGSDAIGAIPYGTTISNNGTSWTCNQSATDQRGELRPLNSGDACTAGAVEGLPPCPSWTATTADELYQCIRRANGNESPSSTANTITLVANINLTSPLPQITTEITLEGAGYFIDGGNSIQIFNVGSAGDLTIKEATLQNGFATNGGAVYNDGTLTLLKSTLFGNNATTGAAVFNDLVSTFTAVNSTFSGNTATNAGGAIYNSDRLTLYNNTFTDNSASTGGSIYNATSAAYLMANIFARGTNGANCFSGGAINDIGYNLSDDATCTNGGTGSATNVSLPLGALADNGGPTPTHLPNADSDAIGAIPYGTQIGPIWSCDQSNTDQRGELRPINSGDACTAGAVEVAPLPPCLSWTVTTADELFACILQANGNESPSPTADTITLGADITLNAALPQITSEITLEGANHFIDGGNRVQLFYVAGIGNFTINQATLQNGSASDGGGIFNRGLLTVTDSTISDNSALAGGGILNAGTLTMTDSTFSGNSALDGGGIYSRGPLTMTNSTFSGNSADLGDGGGIYVDFSPLTVINSTFSGNSADTGGGIFNDGTLTISNSTFSGNSADAGGGIFNYDAAHLAGNLFAVGLNGDNCTNSRTLYDNGYNLSDDATCTNGGTGSLNNAMLNLGPLADNGGPTQTHLPGAGSDAIGAIPNGTTINNNGTTWSCDQSGTDQRGELRPINSGDGCTAGAVEVTPLPPCLSWTVTTADELFACIFQANGNESPSPTADTITLGADITLNAALPQITSEITLEGANHFIDGGWDGVPGSGTGLQIFYVNSGGDFTINQVTLQNGEATNGGGLQNYGTVTVTNSTFSSNSAYGGGGVHNSGPLNITNSTFSDNRADFGGGVYNNGGALTVTSSTVSDNRADYGGGIYNTGPLAVTNSTFSGNSATTNGGGVYNDGGTAHLAGTIFVAGINGANCAGSGTLTDNGYNLSDDASCGFSGTSADNATLNLSALSVTTTPGQQVHTPQTDSDAIGVIPNGTTINNNGVTLACNQTTTDQRGESRPLNSGDACTAGAVEVAPTFSSLTIIKEVAAGSDTATEFDFQITYPSGQGGRFSLRDGLQKVFTMLSPGDHTVLELIPAGWQTLTEQDIVCESAGGSTFAFTADAASDQYGTVISLAAGDDVTCTFTNTRTLQTLSINQAGNGSGSLSNDPGGTSFLYGTVVTLTATADTGSTFTGWSGDADGSTTPLSVTMDGDKVITATFELNQYTLTVIKSGDGSGTISSVPTGIDCGVDCTELLDYGTVVTLTASADTGSTFTGWSGDVSGSNNPVAVTIGADTAVTATFTVNAGNTNPVAVDDSATTDENTPVNIAVLANDSDTDGDTLTVESVTQPTNGSVVIEVDGTVTYTPTPGFTGSDSFTYTISDGNGGSATATVTITVNGVNVAPVAVDDSATTDENTSVNIAVLANDTDADGDSLTVASVTQPTNGSTAIEVDNTVTYTPTTGFSGSDSFSYTISDGNGGADTATVTVTVNAGNTNPVAVDDSATTDENTAVNIAVLANDSDTDGDTLTVASVTQPTNGSTAIEVDGTVTYMPITGFNGSDSFSYTISDGHGGSATATVAVTVNSVNFLPLIANDLAQTNEDSSVTIDVLANDSDPDGDPLQIESVTAPTNGNAAIVNNTIVYTPTPNFNGVDSFTYTANDGNGGANTATVDITVTAVNDAPVAVDDSATTDENTAVTIDVLANDSDVDGDTLTIESVTDPANGTVVNNGTNVTYTPAANFSGSDSFTYTVSDGNGGSATATVTITVNAAVTPFASCGGYDVFETAPGVYEAPGFAGTLHVGTDGYDWLQGTDGPDLMLGLGGPDDIWGKDGNDVICGGDGVDIILGLRGDDTIYGDDQPDWLIGGPGNDTLYGGNGWDDLQGDSGNDVLYGEGGLDVLLGGSADDDLFGGDDPDALYGQNGNDDLDGGAANDYCQGGRGSDTIANCEGASAADATVDETEVDEEAARRSNDGEHGEHAIEQRLRQVFLPLVTR